MDVTTQGGTDSGSQPLPQPGAAATQPTEPKTTQQQQQNDDGDPDFNALDDRTKRYIQKLRSENAGLRTKSNKLETEFGDLSQRVRKLTGAGEEDQIDPVQHIAALEEHAQQQAFQNATLSMAYQAGIPPESLDYFSFLLSKRCEALEEGEELDDEALQEVISKALSVSKPAATQGFASTVGVGGNGQPAPSGQGQVTLEDFARMSIAQKSSLYQTHPDLYTQLTRQAREKNVLIRR